MPPCRAVVRLVCRLRSSRRAIAPGLRLASRRSSPTGVNPRGLFCRCSSLRCPLPSLALHLFFPLPVRSGVLPRMFCPSAGSGRRSRQLSRSASATCPLCWSPVVCWCSWSLLWGFLSPGTPQLRSVLLPSPALLPVLPASLRCCAVLPTAFLRSCSASLLVASSLLLPLFWCCGCLSRGCRPPPVPHFFLSASSCRGGRDVVR